MLGWLQPLDGYNARQYMAVQDWACRHSLPRYFRWARSPDVSCRRVYGVVIHLIAYQSGVLGWTLDGLKPCYFKMNAKTRIDFAVPFFPKRDHLSVLVIADQSFDSLALIIFKMVYRKLKIIARYFGRI